METVVKEIAYVLVFFTMSYAFTPLGGIIAIILLLVIEHIEKKRKERRDTERFFELMREDEERNREECKRLLDLIRNHYGM